jgi:hypothetical protein
MGSNGRARPAASRGWSRLQRELAKALAVLGEGECQYLILSDQRTWRYVQFAVEAGEPLRAEAVSNNYLPGDHCLSQKEIRALLRLGWRPPDAEADPGKPTKGTNYFRCFERPVDLDRVAALAVRTLRDVFQTPSPGRLDYTAFERGGPRIVLPSLWLARQAPEPRKEPVTPSPESVESIRARVLAAIREASGDASIALDKDLDVKVCFGSALLYVRVKAEPPYVCAFSPVLAGVPTGEGVVEHLNELNREVRLARLFEYDGTVFAVVEVFTKPFVVEHVVHACHVLGELADDLGKKLQARFGGRTAFGEPSSMELKN